ncbi:MAG: LptE family protein [Bacteroidaceae bacterium]|nr:LptE family protein [Bacteroidaceae bacterium]MBP5323173.1 LptE family protein [Bacteroidaceae bacterium]
MRRKTFTFISLILLQASLLLSGCKIEYRFNGASINYNEVKSITIDNFPNRASFQWGPMESMFNLSLTDIYARQTKLKQINRNGDLNLSGEITEYAQMNKSVSSDGYSAMIQLRMSVNVVFENRVKPSDNFERKFSATREFDSTQQLNDVQEQLVQEMIDEIVDQVFNATVANW